MQLTNDDSVATVLGTLRKPENYICGMLERLHQCRKQHGSAQVQIGTSGQGLCAYYRISFHKQDGTLEVYDTYFDNHVSFAEEGRAIKGGERWSTTAMTYEEVAALRGSLKVK